MARRFVHAALIAAATVILVAPTALAQADTDCRDYPSQAAAQAVLRADPSDPNGLDSDGDGIACEGRPAPYDRTPVGAASDGGGVGADTLARTGSHTTPSLGLGALLVAAGGVLVWMARYRPRHAS